MISVSQITSILSRSIFHGFQWNGFNVETTSGSTWNRFHERGCGPVPLSRSVPRLVIDRGRSTFLETRSLFRLSSARREQGRAEMDLDALSRPHPCMCARPCVSIGRGGGTC